MARYDLIDRYLVGFQRRIRWRPDADEVIDELRDHLYSAMDEATVRSADEEIAEQRRLLERFGDERQVATALATTPRGGVAVPTASTKAWACKRWPASSPGSTPDGEPWWPSGRPCLSSRCRGWGSPPAGRR